MKCVILAAGEGVRMRPLTLENPKPLLKIAGKPLLQYIVGALPDEVDELILVVGYLGGKIRDFCGTNFLGRPVSYVWQEKKLGTGHALKLCEPHLKNGRFLMLYADDLHSRKGLQECLKHERVILVMEHREPQRFGVVSLNPDGSIENIIEKPEKPASNLVSTGAMILDANIFRYDPDLHSNGEYYLTSMVAKMLTQHKVMAVQTRQWFPIASPPDLEAGEEFLRGNPLS